MKRLMSVVLSMVVVLMMCGGAMAEEFNAQGSCLIPHINAYRSEVCEVTRFFVSNITNAPVQCKIDLYDQNGNDVSQYGGIYIVGNTDSSWQFVTTGDNSFEIPAHSTRVMEFTMGGVPNRIVGYGSIKWKSTDSYKQKALVGSLRYTSQSLTQTYGGDVFINNGNPF